MTAATRLRAFVLSLVVACLVFVAAQAQTVEIVPDEPGHAVMDRYRSTIEVTLTVGNGGPDGPLDLRFSANAVTLKGGGAVGQARVTVSPGRASIAKDGAAQVTLTFDGLDRTGVYETTVSAVKAGDGTALATHKVEVARPAADFAPTVDAAKRDDTVLVEPKSNDAADRTFFFIVGNPDNGRLRCIRLADVTRGARSDVDMTFAFQGAIADLGPCAGLAGTVAPFAPGDRRTVKATIVDELDPDRDSFATFIPLQDAAEPATVFRDVSVAIEPDFEDPVNRWVADWFQPLTFAAVLVGGLFSLLLNHVSPLAVNKLKWRRALQKLGARASGLRNDALRPRLRIMRHEIHNKIHANKLYSDASETDEINTDIEALERKVGLAEQLDGYKRRLTDHNETSFMLGTEIAADIRLGVWSLQNGDVEDTEKRLKTIAAHFDPDAAPETEAQKKLAAHIEALEAIETKIGAAALNLPETLQEDFTLLKDSKDALKKAELSRREWLGLDRRWFRVHLLVERFDQGVMKRQSVISLLCQGRPQAPYMNGLRNRLIETLERAGGDPETSSQMVEQLVRAEDLVRDMETGYLPEDVLERFSAPDGQGSCSIDINPPNPRAWQTVSFTLNMGDGYDQSTAARELYYEWDFGDNTKPSIGKRCFHFYDEMFRYPLTVRAQVEGGPFKTLKLNGADADNRLYVDVRRKRSASKTLTAVQYLTFFASMFVAGLLAYSLHLTAIEGDSFGDLLVPFLIGVGIDQFRDKLANKEITAEQLVNARKGG